MGAIGGVCIRLQSEIGQDLINLASRHHVPEIVLEKVFSLRDDESRSLNMEIFGHFRDRISQEVVKSVKLANDLAEHGVALIQEFESSIIRSEEQKQFPLRVAEDHHREFSDQPRLEQ